MAMTISERIENAKLQLSSLVARFSSRSVAATTNDLIAVQVSVQIATAEQLGRIAEVLEWFAAEQQEADNQFAAAMKQEPNPKSATQSWGRKS